MNATHDDIRRLLRAFGMEADEVIQARTKEAKGVKALKLRIVLEDITDYGDVRPEERSRLLEHEGEVTV